MKTNNSTRHNREIVKNQYSISRFFLQNCLSVYPPTLGEVSREAIQS